MTKEVLNGTTYNYTYDAAGNIKTKTKSSGSGTDTYTYGNSNWRDLLTAYNGNTITYDAVGNPLTYYNGTSFTWVNGKRLATAVNTSTGLNNSYTYDADGLRLTKTVGGVEHKYIWQGGKLVCESWSGKYLEFFYDENGAPYGFAYKSSPTAEQMRWYYILNQQGDVMAIVNSSGVIRATYTYNAFGEILSINNLTTDNLGTLNPLRYRGYYYDAETGFYYLKSRYYDPAICRFINADGLASTGQGFIGCNMFAYCNNNPVNSQDENGNMPKFSQEFIDAVGEWVETVVGVLRYVREYNKNGELYEYWVGNDGNPVWARHHSNHGNPKNHLVPHDHDWHDDGNGHMTEDRKSQTPNPGFSAPDSSNQFKVVVGVSGTAVAGLIVYEVIKWGIAAVLSPATVGGSLAVAGAIP